MRSGLSALLNSPYDRRVNRNGSGVVFRTEICQRQPGILYFSCYMLVVSRVGYAVFSCFILYTVDLIRDHIFQSVVRLGTSMKLLYM